MYHRLLVVENVVVHKSLYKTAEFICLFVTIQIWKNLFSASPDLVFLTKLIKSFTPSPVIHNLLSIYLLLFSSFHFIPPLSMAPINLVSLAPELLYGVYIMAFPFLAHQVFDVIHKHHHDPKEKASTVVTFGVLFSILYSWMYVLGPRVYLFLYPIICIVGIIPLLKLMALEFHCLSSDMHSHIRESFKNYYVYLATPSEVCSSPFRLINTKE